jgi:CMP-N-acetylneuraminic acid synthetase
MECVYIDPTGNWEYVVDPPDSSFGRQCYRDDEYFINGAMYAATPDWIRKHRAFLVKGQEIGFIRMPASRGLDIDIHDDLDRLM